MRVSLSWVRRILGRELPLPAGQLQQLLTLRSTEIEGLHQTGPNLDGVVVGKVLTCVQHPNADRLRVCTVAIGGDTPSPIVCGAPNVAVGQTVAVATVGTTLTMRGADGTSTRVTIKAAKLRGEPSQGMICAEDELGLGASHDGIMVLDDAQPAGRPLAEALGIGDQVFEIDNHGITHRPDLWGHWGWAREIAAITGTEPPAPLDLAHAPTPGQWSADIRDAGCSVYCGAVVDGVANQPSPNWMRDSLEACGLRSLGLLIDVTNYVMLELGEPLHAFDRRSLTSSRIVVRSAVTGEQFTTLDGRSHRLEMGDLVIDDGGKPIALAGIMGGDHSMVREDTTSVVLEAAAFSPDRIRRTRIRLGLSTDSSTRFEKGLSVEVASAAINRVIALLLEACPRATVAQRFLAGSPAGEDRQIAYDPALFRRYFADDLPAREQSAMLGRLGLKPVSDGFAIPWWRRKDLHSAVDLVEEIGRLRGFEVIVPQVPRLPAGTPQANALRDAEHRARSLLSAQGWDETATYGFVSDAWCDLLAVPVDRRIGLANPLSADWTALRPSLVPNLIEAAARNRRHFASLEIYEIGKRYLPGIGAPGTPDEELWITGAVIAANDEAPVFAARDALLCLLRGLGHDPVLNPGLTNLPEGHGALLPNRSTTVLVGGKPVGWCGEPGRDIRSKGGLAGPVAVFTLALESLVAGGAPPPRRFVPPSRFQSVTRDFTWICGEDLAFGRLVEATRRAAKGLCRNIDLISVYRGTPYGADEKAVSLTVTLQADDRTLDDQELTRIHDSIAKGVQGATGARVRAG